MTLAENISFEFHTNHAILNRFQSIWNIIERKEKICPTNYSNRKSAR